jgi:predicted transcriptional regulator
MRIRINKVLPRLAERRRQLHLSQSDVAKLAGVSQSYVSRVEVAAVDPSVSSLDRICKALRWTVAELLNERAT